MLARDYRYVGRQGSLVVEWNSGIGRLQSVGNDRENDITISDSVNHEVQTCSTQGHTRGRPLGGKGRLSGEFMQPCQTALSADGAVLAVADCGNNRVQLFDAETRLLLSSIGKKGQIRPGRMEGPQGVAFVDGRREMLVADTGNERLQVFHVEALAAIIPNGVPPSASTTSKNNSWGRRETSIDDRAAGTWQGVSVDAWAQSQTPAHDHRAISDTEKAARERKEEGVGASAGTGSSATEHEQASSPCLLVFSGFSEGMTNRRRTAGETVSGEGRMRQPCDVAYYWRGRKHADNVADAVPLSRKCPASTAPPPAARVRAWIPSVPPWYRCRNSADEESLRKELLSPTSRRQSRLNILQPNRADPALRGAQRLHHQAPRRSLTGGCKALLKGSSDRNNENGYGKCGAGEPEVGSFVVRETGVKGELQLMFVATTKATEDTDATCDVIGDGISLSPSDESDGSGWMQRLTRLGVAPREDGQTERGGSGREEGSNAGPSSLSSSPCTFEVRSEKLHVLPGREGVKSSFRTYGCLMSLLRAYRWSSDDEGANRLVGVIDTRGERALVAVAERGGGRVRILHYAPALEPFYATELTHVHSIEGLQRPTSVSFSDDGDLVVTDEGARKVFVYSKLSGRWKRVHTFGPGYVTDGRADGNISQGKTRTLSSSFSHIRSEAVTAGQGPGNGNTKAGLDASGGRGGGGGGGKEATVGAQEQRWGGRDEDRNANVMVVTSDIDWKPAAAPTVARFLLPKAAEGADEYDQGWPRRHRNAEMVVGTSDGRVRVLAGPKRQECGLFAVLDSEMVLSIVELLGYRSSEVLAYVNRTMAHLRATLRREWRLHPLTPGYLAKIKLEFLRWGRVTSGEGIPGRGTAVDGLGLKLCNQFLANSVCFRPACPYSHDQPWIDPGLATNTDACILFRTGVEHAMVNLYGQIFTWEWEGDLYRLFREKSSLRILQERRDPMTRGIDGAEVIRECTEKSHYVLDYTGFMDYATVVHEHVIGLRHWYPRGADANPEGESREITATKWTPQVVGGDAKLTSSSRYKCDVANGSPANHPALWAQEDSNNHRRRTRERDGRDHGGDAMGRGLGQVGESKTTAIGLTMPTGVESQPDSKSVGNRSNVSTKHCTRDVSIDRPSSTSDLIYHDRELDATPWLGWDFAASNRVERKEADYDDEEPAVNRTYGEEGAEEQRECSVNKRPATTPTGPALAKRHYPIPGEPGGIDDDEAGVLLPPVAAPSSRRPRGASDRSSTNPMSRQIEPLRVATSGTRRREQLGAQPSTNNAMQEPVSSGDPSVEGEQMRRTGCAYLSERATWSGTYMKRRRPNTSPDEQMKKEELATVPGKSILRKVKMMTWLQQSATDKNVEPFGRWKPGIWERTSMCDFCLGLVSPGAGSTSCLVCDVVVHTACALAAGNTRGPAGKKPCEIGDGARHGVMGTCIREEGGGGGEGGEAGCEVEKQPENFADDWEGAEANSSIWVCGYCIHERISQKKEQALAEVRRKEYHALTVGEGKNAEERLQIHRKIMQCAITLQASFRGSMARRQLQQNNHDRFRAWNLDIAGVEGLPTGWRNREAHGKIFPLDDYVYRVLVTVVEDMTPVGLDGSSVAPLQLFRFDTPAVSAIPASAPSLTSPVTATGGGDGRAGRPDPVGVEGSRVSFNGGRNGGGAGRIKFCNERITDKPETPPIFVGQAHSHLKNDLFHGAGRPIMLPLRTQQFAVRKLSSGSSKGRPKHTTTGMEGPEIFQMSTPDTLPEGVTIRAFVRPFSDITSKCGYVQVLHMQGGVKDVKESAHRYFAVLAAGTLSLYARSCSQKSPIHKLNVKGASVWVKAQLQVVILLRISDDRGRTRLQINASSSTEAKAWKTRIALASSGGLPPKYTPKAGRRAPLVSMPSCRTSQVHRASEARGASVVGRSSEASRTSDSPPSSAVRRTTSQEGRSSDAPPIAIALAAS